MAVTAILGAVDALGKIIGEPIKAISQSMSEKSKMKMQMQKDKQDLDLEAKRIKTELEKNREIIKIDANVRKWNADIDDYISRKEIERNQKIVDAILEYRRITLQEMETIVRNLNVMQVELVAEAHTLLIAKFNEYNAIQERSIKKCDERLEEIQKKYADNERVRIKMEDVVINQMEGVIRMSEKFIEELDEDIREMVKKNVDRIDKATDFVDQVLGNWGNMISTSNNSFNAGNYIEQKNRVLLK